MKIVLDKPLDWERSGILSLGKIDKCDRCESENMYGIEVDTSGGEYGSLKICFKCIEQLKNQ